MSCQLSILSRFQDVISVRKFLFPLLKDNLSHAPSEDQTPDGEDWGEDWGWAADESVGNETPTDGSDPFVESVDDETHKWLQAGLVSLSPNNDIIAIANEDRICVLTQKWDPENKEEEIDTHLTSVWQSSIKQEEGEQITDVLCLPLASQKRSTQGAPDWTCVLVGFTSGYVRMYTETGVLLLSQLLHLEPVQKLKCRTYEPPRFVGMAEKHEELIILYKKAVVSIDGFSLIQSLRACRNQVARATASGGDSYVQPPPLAYKKWALGDQEKVNDLVSCGVKCANPFDQLRNASMQGGFSSTPRTNPPAASVYLSSGSGPTLGFFYAIEGSTQPILSEVAIAMAHKLKSALLSAASGWLGFGSRQKEEAKDKAPKIEPATPLPLRFGLPDKRRVADSIVLSPCNNYIATTDSFGRVILVDVERGIAVRMWKGYREAQTGWVQVKEDGGSSPQKCHSPGHSRVAQFLIIYAPRRGILEVWATVHGPRVAAFNVSKHCVLVCPSYGMMGLNNVTYRGVKSRTFQCALVDPDGSIKTLDIPFHLALSDKSSKRARDLHLLKKLKAALKEASTESESLRSIVKEIFLDIRIASISHQALERILSTRYLNVTFMQDIVQAVIARLSSKGEDNLDIDSKLLLRFAHMEIGLLETYDAIHKLIESTSVPAAAEPDIEDLQSSLGVHKEEAERISEQLLRFERAVETGGGGRSVQFSAGSKVPLLAPTSFLHCFCARSHTPTASQSTASQASQASLAKAPAAIYISKEVTEDRRKALAHLFFHGCLTGKCKAEDIGVVLQKSNLAPDHLMKLLLLHCLSMDDIKLSAAPCLKALVKTITAMTDVSQVVVDHNQSAPWWQRVRDACSQSEQNSSAYITALVCRRVSADFLSSQTQAKDPDADTASDKEEEDLNAEDAEKRPGLDLSAWEDVSVDLADWELLIRQLEDVLALSSLFTLNIPTSSRPATAAHANKEPVTVSVAKLLEGGKGSISELVARYVASQGLRASDLYKLTSEGEGHSPGQEGSSPASEKEGAAPSSPMMETVRTYLEELRHQFPGSLDNDILISNCGWEYAVLWNKEVEEVHHLRLSLEYLKLVQNAVLRQGVSSMLWHMFVTKRMSAAANLMEKVGKAPKDRLCRKEVSMSEESMTPFMELTVELLNIIMEANCEANEVPVLKADHNWQSVRGPASLGELAVDTKVTNYGLVRLHWQLALFMHATLLFRLKAVKVMSLFDRKGKAAFFKDLHTHPLLPDKIDHSLAQERTTMLCRIITEAVEGLGPPVVGHNMPPPNPSKRPNALTLHWPRTCFSLAPELKADQEALKRHYVTQLYSYGHDDLARTVHGLVSEQEEFGRQLLLVAGRRLAYRVMHENPGQMPRLMGELSPQVAAWIRSMEVDKLRYHPALLIETLKLLKEACGRLGEQRRQHDIALELIEFTEVLITLNISMQPEMEHGSTEEAAAVKPDTDQLEAAASSW